MATASPSRKPPIVLPDLSPSIFSHEHLNLPTDLRQTLISALISSPPSIAAIQSTFTTSTISSGWTTQLQQYILQTAKLEPGLGEREILQRVLQGVRGSATEYANDDKKASQADRYVGDTQSYGCSGAQKSIYKDTAVLPLIPPGVVEAGVKMVKAQLEDLCVVTDEEAEWYE